MGHALRATAGSEVFELRHENDQLPALVAEARPGPGPWPFRPRGGRGLAVPAPPWAHGESRAGRWRGNPALRNHASKNELMLYGLRLAH